MHHVLSVIRRTSIAWVGAAADHRAATQRVGANGVVRCARCATIVAEEDRGLLLTTEEDVPLDCDVVRGLDMDPDPDVAAQRVAFDELIAAVRPGRECGRWAAS